MRLNGVFEASEAAAAQYVENLRRYESEQELISRRILVEAREKADAMIAGRSGTTVPRTKTGNGSLLGRDFKPPAKLL